MISFNISGGGILRFTCLFNGRHSHGVGRTILIKTNSYVFKLMFYFAPELIDLRGITDIS